MGNLATPDVVYVTDAVMINDTICKMCHNMYFNVTFMKFMWNDMQQWLLCAAKRETNASSDYNLR